jgi:homoserine/homoserine lactone efflux protein
VSVDTWIAFATLWASIVVFPGPNAAYAVAVSSRFGARRGLFAAAGFSLAVAVYVLLVSFGLLAFLAASAEWFAVLKWIGVGYLVWLGIQFWRAGAERRPAAKAFGSPRGTFLRAALISLTNPKSALAYVAVYPHFIDPAAAPGMQLALIGATSVALSFLIYSGYALLAGRLGGLVKTNRGILLRNRTFAMIFVGAGAALAMAEKR